MNIEAVIGLEVHVQLKTASKIFSCSSAQFGGEPNAQVDPVCLGLPGVLPVLNRKAVEYAIRMGLATNCRIARRSLFARKHYFYPDLPKGYQISQYEEPLCENGYVEITGSSGVARKIHIIRIHLEEDAGRSVHQETYVTEDESLIDLNRCGVPLIEIVSGPDLRAPEEAGQYLEKIRQLVRYLDISDGDMSEGSLRCDANISIREGGAAGLGVKTELKNMNSISGVERALAVEIARQTALRQAGERIAQETLLWDADRNAIVPMRSKEYAHDYRYFPDPDLVPVVVDEHWLQEIQAQLPELPAARRQRFEHAYGLPAYDADVLTRERELADYFESVAKACGNPKAASNWVMGEVQRVLNERKQSIRALPLKPEQLAGLISSVEAGTISRNIGKKIFDEMLRTGRDAGDIIREQGLEQISDAGALDAHIGAVLANNPDAVAKYKAGDQKVFGFLVGQLMRATRGKANPKIANQLLRKALGA